jgi:alanyl-tRNA synthetase
LIKKIEEFSGEVHGQSEITTISMRIIAEHTRAFTFLLGDDIGMSPSNTDQGYVIRRLLRRAIRHGKKLGIREQNRLIHLSSIVIEEYQDVYPELGRNREFILSEVQKEKERFEKTLEK